MLPLDPERLAGSQTLAADLERLTTYVTASPPTAHGIPLDPNTLDQLRGAARAVGLSDAEIDRAIIPTETVRQS